MLAPPPGCRAISHGSITSRQFKVNVKRYKNHLVLAFPFHPQALFGGTIKVVLVTRQVLQVLEPAALELSL
jgi:hypothetical protein